MDFIVPRSTSLNSTNFQTNFQEFQMSFSGIALIFILWYPFFEGPAGKYDLIFVVLTKGKE